MSETVQKANMLGTTITLWFKIGVGVVLLILAVGTAWYQIEANASDNIRQDKQFEQVIQHQTEQFNQVMSAMTKEFEIQSRRSDNRNKRSKEENVKLHKHDNKQDAQIIELIKEIWYLKGKLEK